MQEIKEPTFVQFDRPGASVQGLLIGIDRPEVNGKKVPRFIVAEGSLENGNFVATGERLSCLGTYQINNSIQGGHIDRYVSIVYEGEDRERMKNGNALRRFKIFVSNRPPNQAAGNKQTPSVASDLGITDEDIPF